MTADVPGCLGCDLTRGRTPLPGGCIHETPQWVIEHCIGPLPVGTLIVKPVRHAVRFADLTDAEAGALGPLLKATAAAVTAETGCDQTYICQWSHAGWVAGHLHFVVQPAWDAQRERFERPGPFLQAELFDLGETPDTDAVEAVCERLRARLAALEPAR
jgi:diadenosine tetraphosphate (Ap4A) HIT family hydrolase